MYKCIYCKKEYSSITDAYNCAKRHDLVTVLFKRSDLINLIEFFYTKDENLLTESLIDSIYHYQSFNPGVTE